VSLDNGETLYRDFVSGEGLCSDQSHIQIFGLGNAAAAEITVNYIDGREEVKSGDFVNTLVRF
jgi:hypothetical protein